MSAESDFKKPKEPTIEELFEMFPDNETAMRWLEGNIWPDGRECPKCGNRQTCVAKNSHMPYYCYKCERRFSVKAGTIMKSSHISYQHWAITVYIVATRAKGISSMQLHRDLGITQSSAWYLLRKIKKSWRSLVGPELRDGPVGSQ